ncbi:hypothetical protein QVD17_36981 [Tagetes erecta]|uniref:Uncharacterized protein n=1 Tax=Tagetes erecta TaxID=13708 RepID=A0AAD8JVQ3_TARER|nr:hypothetical protein QVD17_36981 [Tagetes erecta]
MVSYAQVWEFIYSLIIWFKIINEIIFMYNHAINSSYCLVNGCLMEYFKSFSNFPSKYISSDTSDESNKELNMLTCSDAQRTPPPSSTTTTTAATTTTTTPTLTTNGHHRQTSGHRNPSLSTVFVKKRVEKDGVTVVGSLTVVASGDGGGSGCSGGGSG